MRGFADALRAGQTPRLVLDACVLYPTVTREMLLAVAGRGLFAPRWSARLLEEWRRAAARHGPVEAAQAEGRIALLRAAHAEAEILPAPGIEARLWLPDPSDVHVLATAIAAPADAIVTWNARDFPRGTLRDEGVARYGPDEVLMWCWMERPNAVAAAAETVRAEAERLDAAPANLRALLKKARLPRLAKALSA